MWPHSIQAAHHIWGGAVLKHGWVDGNFKCPGAPPWTLHAPSAGMRLPPAKVIPISLCRSPAWPEEPKVEREAYTEVSELLSRYHRARNTFQGNTHCAEQGSWWPQHISGDRNLWRRRRAGADHCSKLLPEGAPLSPGAMQELWMPRPSIRQHECSVITHLPPVSL